jgi:hypothetical protein
MQPHDVLNSRMTHPPLMRGATTVFVNIIKFRQNPAPPCDPVLLRALLRQQRPQRVHQCHHYRATHARRPHIPPLPAHVTQRIRQPMLGDKGGGADDEIGDVLVVDHCLDVGDVDVPEVVGAVDHHVRQLVQLIRRLIHSRTHGRQKEAADILEDLLLVRHCSKLADLTRVLLSYNIRKHRQKKKIIFFVYQNTKQSQRIHPFDNNDKSLLSNVCYN